MCCRPENWPGQRIDSSYCANRKRILNQEITSTEFALTYIWAASFASLACMSLISVPAGSTFQSTWVILFIYHYTNIFLNSTGLFLGLQQMFKDIIGSIFPIFSITHSHRSQCGTFVFIVIYKIAILSEKLQPYLLSSHCDWRDSLGRYFIFWGYLAYSQAVEALNIKKNLFLGC